MKSSESLLKTFKEAPDLRSMTKSWTVVITAALFLSPVCGWIKLQQHDEDRNLSPTTAELLSSFNQCIVFIFDWAVETNYLEPLTSTYYFIFYSKSMSCALIVETLMEYRNKGAVNVRFHNYNPHPLFTKYTTTLINLYSSAATGSHLAKGIPATYYIPMLLRTYNIPFNYVLLFMSNQVFSSNNMKRMFSECADVSAPAVYLLILDESEVNVVGFGHVLHSAPYLFKVNTFRDSHMQRLHQMIHKDLQQSQLSIITLRTPRKCGFAFQFLHPTDECALSALMEFHNMTYCMGTSCPGYRISIIKTSERLYDKPLRAYIRRNYINYEFINYGVANHEYGFICVLETGPMGFMAFVQAFDLQSWIIVATVCTCLTVTVACLSTKKTASFPTKLLPSSAVVVIMLLFDRFYASNKIKLGLQRAASRQVAAALLITLWAFGAMLLGSSYSGKMVSELTAPSIPPLPHNIHELALSEYPILTYNNKLVPQNNGKLVVQSDLQYKIEDYFNRNQDPNPSLTNDIRRLRKAITLIGKPAPLEYQPSDRKSSNVLFVFADQSYCVQAVKLWAVLTSGRLRTLIGGKLPFFNYRTQMIVQSTSLFPIFRKFFASQCDTGLLDYWENIYKAQSANVFLTKSLLRSEGMSMGNQTTLGRALMRKMNVATIWHDLDSLVENSDSWSQITMDTLSPAFQLYAISLLVSAAALVQEKWPFQAVLRRLIKMAKKAPSVVRRMLESF